VRSTREDIIAVTRVKISQPLAMEQGFSREPFNERPTVTFGGSYNVPCGMANFSVFTEKKTIGINLGLGCALSDGKWKQCLRR